MKLLIIGNGFDKAASLNSGFDDFIKTRFNESFSSDATVAEVLEFFNSRNKKTTFIEKCCLLFKIKSNLDELFWSDVEEILYQLLNDDEYCIKKAINYMSKKNEIKGRPVRDINSKEFTIVLYAIIINDFKLFYIMNDNEFVLDKRINVYKFLKEDLRNFEIEFCKYLTKEKKNNFLKYNFYSENLLKALIGKGVFYNVLSFNYTIPQSIQLDRIENVHGRLYDISGNTCNIIIGIDSTKINHDSEAYPFTKTFRKVEQYALRKDKEIVDILNDRFKYSEIIFYGHSLNKQDYAYFQTIFDKYDLYTSKIKLTFCYSNYKTNDDSIIKQRQVKAVIQLIETYGPTLDNKYKGKNLLHKLLNEQRLKIIEIDLKNINRVL